MWAILHRNHKRTVCVRHRHAHTQAHTHIHTHHCCVLQRVNSVLTLKEYHFFQVPKEALFNKLMT